MLCESQQLVNSSPDLIGDKVSNSPLCSSSSGKTLDGKAIEDYENIDFSNEPEELEIFDVHMLEDDNYENDSCLGNELDDSHLNKEHNGKIEHCLENNVHNSSELTKENLNDKSDHCLENNVQDSSELTRGIRQTSKRKKSLELDNLLYKCEWKNCTYKTSDESKFHIHVSYHIPDLETKTLGNGEEVYVCLWADCSHLTGGVNEIQQHVTYHSYHTKLKTIGEKLVQEWNLPKCMYGSETRNMVTDQSTPKVCEWDSCHKEFNNVQVYFYHIQTHVNEVCSGPFPKKEKIQCKWDGCIRTTKCTSQVYLADHLRTHTKEKVVGCPTCGYLFSSNTKLNDHCKRQLPNESFEFQCSICYKHFSSVRLLKDHMRGHVNFFRCCYCDMTCTSRHTLSAHIRFKHLDSKPFICSTCSYSCKTKSDLKKHLATHKPKIRLHCEEASCNYSCETKNTLLSHIIEEHQDAGAIYCCHLEDCKSRFKRACYLTKHLTTEHCLSWSLGHSRFIYCRQKDGTYKLKNIRYDSEKLYGQSNTDLSRPKSSSKLRRLQADGSKSFKVTSLKLNTNKGMPQMTISITNKGKNVTN